MHLYTCSIIACEKLIHRTAFSCVQIRVERFSLLVLRSDILQFILTESVGDVGFADAVIDAHVIVHHVFAVHNGLIVSCRLKGQFYLLLLGILLILLVHLVLECCHFEGLFDAVADGVAEVVDYFVNVEFHLFCLEGDALLLDLFVCFVLLLGDDAFVSD